MEMRDIMAIVLGYGAVVAILAIVALVAVLTARRLRSKPAPVVAVPVAPVEEAPAPTAPGSAGQLMLHDVAPKTAAMLMAIVANKLGKPLNELRFISIKEVKENDL